jgi:hypothetical protein
MRLVIVALAGTLGLMGCAATVTQAPAAPVVTKTVAPPAASSAAPSVVPDPAAPQSAVPQSAVPQAAPGASDPWAVVSAYYGDIESGSYPQAWNLLSSGAVSGQTYQQFVNGFACTGAQQLTEQSESGDQVSFTLAATDTCTGAVQQFSGTDTVSGGRIVAAHITQTG